VRGGRGKEEERGSGREREEFKSSLKIYSIYLYI